MRSLMGNRAQCFGTIILVVVLPMFTVAAWAQAPKDSTPQSGDPATAAAQPTAARDHKADASAAQTETKSAPMTPEEARQAQLVADTNKLFQLAEELKAEVAKSNKDTLSLAVVKKA